MKKYLLLFLLLLSTTVNIAYARATAKSKVYSDGIYVSTNHIYGVGPRLFVSAFKAPDGTVKYYVNFHMYNVAKDNEGQTVLFRWGDGSLWEIPCGKEGSAGVFRRFSNEPQSGYLEIEMTPEIYKRLTTEGISKFRYEAITYGETFGRIGGGFQTFKIKPEKFVKKLNELIDAVNTELKSYDIHSDF